MTVHNAQAKAIRASAKQHLNIRVKTTNTEMTRVYDDRNRPATAENRREEQISRPRRHGKRVGRVRERVDAS